VKTSGNDAKIFLLAIDGLSFTLLKKWTAMGALPNFKRLLEEGCWGLLKSFTPSNSAVIWTSVMTGMSPQKHGIDSFIYYQMGKRNLKKSQIKKILKFGTRPLFRWLKKRDYVNDIPFSLDMVQQKMLWEIFAEAGRRVGVVNWWHSYPAYEVPGFIISDRFNYWRLEKRHKFASMDDSYLAYPPWFLETWMGNMVDPLAIPRAVYRRFMNVTDKQIQEMRTCHYSRHQLMSEFKYLYTMDETTRKIALSCLQEFSQPEFLALYLRGIDIISHCACKYMPEYRDSQLNDEEIEAFGETVFRYYCYIDKIIMELLHAVSDSTHVIIASDHGFAREPDGRFGHKRTKPPGSFIINGPNIKRGLPITNATLYDIAPTMLYLGGLPISKKMDGRLLTECLEEKFFQNNPGGSIDSYGKPHRLRESPVPDTDEEVKERLRALGYID
jgi:predicted AlkP superfamily phosphohydrolase/phosphomutase